MYLKLVTKGLYNNKLGTKSEKSWKQIGFNFIWVCIYLDLYRSDKDPKGSAKHWFHRQIYVGTKQSVTVAVVLTSQLIIWKTSTELFYRNLYNDQMVKKWNN